MEDKYGGFSGCLKKDLNLGMASGDLIPGIAEWLVTFSALQYGLCWHVATAIALHSRSR